MRVVGLGDEMRTGRRRRWRRAATGLGQSGKDQHLPGKDQVGIGDVVGVGDVVIAKRIAVEPFCDVPQRVTCGDGVGLWRWCRRRARRWTGWRRNDQDLSGEDQVGIRDVIGAGDQREACAIAVEADRQIPQRVTGHHRVVRQRRRSLRWWRWRRRGVGDQTTADGGAPEIDEIDGAEQTECDRLRWCRRLCRRCDTVHHDSFARRRRRARRRRMKGTVGPGAERGVSSGLPVLRWRAA